jgi:methionine synthase II (cobalamin-independent)
MIDAAWTPSGVHLVGSMALPSVDDVFAATGNILGRRLRRIPDGEPGGRNLWISWQYPLLRANPFLQVDENPDRVSSAGLKLVRVADGVQPEEVAFGELGYSREARASYVDFVRAREKGVVPRSCRFQVCLPTPFAVVYPFVSGPSRHAVERAYEDAMRREVEKVCAEIPHQDLAIQWDICVEMVMWDGRSKGYPSPFTDTESEIIERIARLCSYVPSDVELGFHLCYGDWEAKHFIEPIDAGAMTSLANAICAAAGRDVAFVHMPVPINRSDDAFFEPLRQLKVGPKTEIYLGVVHREDGESGTRNRIAAARKVLDHFGVATECGLGRCKKPSTVMEILHVHSAVTNEPS